VNTSVQISLFYSYAHIDKALREELDKHLSLLRRDGLITQWYDRDISVGTEWAKQIDQHLNTAHIILLLISSDFLASTYCYSVEMNRALERHEAGEACVIPILLRPVDWQNAPFAKFQVLPTNHKPVTNWRNRDDAFLDIASNIRKAIEKLLSSSSSTESLPIGNNTSRIAHDEKDGMDGIYKAVQSVFLFNLPLNDPREFYGRKSEYTTLLDRAYLNGSTSIIGSRRIGKTWLIHYFRLMAQKKLGPRFRIAYLDATLPECATVSGFTVSALKALDENTLISPYRDVGLSSLEQAVKDLIRNHQHPVLCIDEFERFSNSYVFDLSFFQGLRAIAASGLCLVIASNISLIDIVSKQIQTSPFFNIFEQLTLKPFTFKEAAIFVRTKGSHAGFIEQERELLLSYGKIDEGQWSPLRLQLAGKLLLEDKLLAEQDDSDHYRPNDPLYWETFEQRLEERYRGVVR
jgi:TIR domain/Bacterial TniB protein